MSEQMQSEGGVSEMPEAASEGVPFQTGDDGAGRRSGVRWYEALAVLVLLGAFGYWSLEWGMEGAIHGRTVETVPDLKGKPVSAALDALSALNLAMRKEGMEFNGDVPIGTVLRQIPAAGTKVREGKIVRVIISQGGRTVFVPNLTGLPLRNAEMMLRESQLALGEVTESYSLRMDKGMVLSQNPAAEASVARNSMINAVISGGAPPAGIVLMPDFQRKNLSDAQAWANGAGIDLAVAKDFASLFPYGVILGQEPAPDFVLAPGTPVKVTISGKSNSEPSPAGAMRPLHYAVPQGSSDNLVRIVLADGSGERELFNGMRAPGSKIDLQVPAQETGQARLKIYLNGILVEERDW